MGKATPFNAAKTILSFRCVARTVTFKVFENLASKGVKKKSGSINYLTILEYSKSD